jgi:hypothetical protein
MSVWRKAKMRHLAVAGLLSAIVLPAQQPAVAQDKANQSEANQSEASQSEASQDAAPSKTTPEPNVPTEDSQPTKSSRLNVPTKTAGGTQLWTDYAWRQGFRVQQHALTGHWRLLDAGNVRRAWGTKAQCLESLEMLMPRPEQPEKPQHTVVLLHGLMRTARCMKPLEAAFKEAGVDTVIRFSYASTRCSILDHATALREVLEGLPPNSQFSFIAHSMGSIVIRRLIGDLQQGPDPEGILPRCQALVMLGPPNQGAAIARRLANTTGLYGFITGKGGLELGPQWDDFVEHLAIPPFPFAIIAGDRSESRLQNPLIDRSSDFLVSVEEAKLDGSEQFHVVPVIHSKLMTDKRAKELAIAFILAHKKTRD